MQVKIGLLCRAGINGYWIGEKFYADNSKNHFIALSMFLCQKFLTDIDANEALKNISKGIK